LYYDTMTVFGGCRDEANFGDFWELSLSTLEWARGLGGPRLWVEPTRVTGKVITPSPCPRGGWGGGRSPLRTGLGVCASVAVAAPPRATATPAGASPLPGRLGIVGSVPKPSSGITTIFPIFLAARGSILV